MNSEEMLKIVENYCRKTNSKDDEIKVALIADKKTVFVEQIGDSGRAIMLSTCKVDGVAYCVGYSSRTQTVYLRLAA
jgi:hypothetical protein